MIAALAFKPISKMMKPLRNLDKKKNINSATTTQKQIHCEKRETKNTASKAELIPNQAQIPLKLLSNLPKNLT